MSRGYDQLAWVDYPETLTPISAANLNRMENGIANLYSDRNKLESNMAYVEDGDTSSRHYDVDAYLMHNGVFYKVTEEINIGDTLDYGLDGNIAHVDISSQFSSTGCVELTQAQYDALPEEDKMADIIYLITDSPDNHTDLDEVFGDFATVEYTNTASKAYAVGDYLVYDNKFYLVTDDIAQGGTITPGTNVEQTTVGEEIKKISVIGEIVTATNYSPALGNQGTSTPVSAMFLSKGKWLIVASGYSPIMNNNNVNSQATRFSIIFHDGGEIAATSLHYNFCVLGIATVTADNTRIDGVVINWESTTPSAGTNYTMKAIRII